MSFARDPGVLPRALGFFGGAKLSGRLPLLLDYRSPEAEFSLLLLLERI